MREVLQRLNRIDGIKGSLVVTPDGLPIAVALPADYDPETAAGLGAAVGKMVTDWAGSAGAGKISVGMIEAKFARLFVSAITWGFVIAVAEKQCALGEARLEMRAAANTLDEICARLSRSMDEEENRARTESNTLQE